MLLLTNKIYDCDMKNGFTLVELSIVLVIIGLLIGGLLVGQSLIDSARVNRLVSDLKQYEIATVHFRSKFKKYPGDSAFFVPAGFSNDLFGWGDPNGDGVPDVTDCNGAYFNWEPGQYWAHLSQAGMLKGNFPIISPDASWAGCTGGIHTQLQYFNGQLSPYTKVLPISNSGRDKRIIVPYSISSPYVNMSFEFYTLPMDTLALENKMSAESLPGTTSNLVGLKNRVGLGNCINDGIVKCSDATAETGWFYLYIAKN